MANRYWVTGGTGNWSSTTNWSTSSGGSSGAAIPGSGDFAILDGSSGSGNSVIDQAFTVQGVDASLFTGTLTHNTAVTLTINTAASNAFKLAAGMTYTPATVSSIVAFTNTSGNAVLTSGGHALAAVTVNGVGGTCQQGDNLAINSIANAILTITNGTFDSNSHTLTAILISSNNSNTRVFKLGTSLTLGGNQTTGQTIWNFATTTGLTFTKNSCNITVLTPNSQILTMTFAGGGLTYNNITFNNTTQKTSCLISGANTFATFTIGSGWIISLTVAVTQTVTGFVATGTQSAPTSITSSTAIAAATISCASGNVTVTWGAVTNVVGSGGATFTAANTLSFGVNTGWSISAPADATASSIVTTIWTDLLSGTDFQTAGSVGALLAAMVNMGYVAPAIGRATCDAGGSTTSIPTTVVAPIPSGSIANQFVGRRVLFDATTSTVALRAQSHSITATSASAAPTFTVDAMTAAPAAGDTFSII